MQVSFKFNFSTLWLSMEEMASGYEEWLGIQWLSIRGEPKRSGPPAGGLGGV